MPIPPSLLGEQNPSTKGNKFIIIIPQPNLPSVQTKSDLSVPLTKLILHLVLGSHATVSAMQQ